MTNNKDIAKVLAKLDYDICVVTMGKGSSGNALTVSWLTQVSGAPPMIAMAIKSSHQSTPMLKEAGAFAVNFLSDNQETTAKAYYGPAESGYDKLSGSTLGDAPVTGSPLLSGVVGYLDCKIETSVIAGDHTVFIGEVLAAELNDDLPLLNTSRGGMKYRG